MSVQLSVQITKEIIKLAKQKENLRQNFELYQNALNILETEGWWKMLFASSVMGTSESSSPVHGMSLR